MPFICWDNSQLSISLFYMPSNHVSGPVAALGPSPRTSAPTPDSWSLTYLNVKGPCETFGQHLHSTSSSPEGRAMAAETSPPPLKSPAAEVPKVFALPSAAGLPLMPSLLKTQLASAWGRAFIVVAPKQSSLIPGAGNGPFLPDLSDPQVLAGWFGGGGGFVEMMSLLLRVTLGTEMVCVCV